MAKTRRRRSSKKRGGDRELEIVFLQLGKATMLLTKNIKITLESEDGEKVTHTIPMNDYIAFSLGHEMISDGADRDQIEKAMTAAGWEFLPDKKYPSFSIMQ
jgi:hypothetical protein